MFKSTAEAIAASPVNAFFHDLWWVVPVSQSLHIIGMSVLLTSVLLINARLLGYGTRFGRVTAQVSRLVPWMWRGLALCVLTGSLQTIIEPVRQFITPIFWWKLLLIATLAVLTAWVARSVRDHGPRWDAEDRPSAARIFAVVSSLAWITVITFGRFIGYVWERYT